MNIYLSLEKTKSRKKNLLLTFYYYREIEVNCLLVYLKLYCSIKKNRCFLSLKLHLFLNKIEIQISKYNELISFYLRVRVYPKKK